MFERRLKPEEVFTPRSADVSDMYVARPELEKALRGAMRGNLHLLLHGESGCGKSWLYKKTFADLSVQFMVANLANASRLGSIGAELRNLVDRLQRAVKTSYTEEKSADVSAGFASGSLSHAGEYEIGQMEPFERALYSLRERAGENPAVIVFDNLEAAMTELLLKELADLIILCDDERYAKYNVKILIVGVPGGIKEYFYRTPHHSTVANRLHELPEVAKLTQSECEMLVRKGFEEKLKYTIPELTDGFAAHVGWTTDRIPQMLHEYCLHIALEAEAGREVTPDIIRSAVVAWLKSSLYAGYSAVESHMNERDTKAGRRNQVLFALSHCKGEFKSSEVEAALRQDFPTSTHGTTLNVAQILAALSSGERPLVRRSAKGDGYRLADPKYRMILRAMLMKTTDERVERREIGSSDR